MKYWYELIHRPIDLHTQPSGYTDIDRDHINRSGFPFGKVAYDHPLSQQDLFHYDMAPLPLSDYVCIENMKPSFFSANRIKMTIDVLNYLVQNELLTAIYIEGHHGLHVNIEEMKEYARANFDDLKVIYKELKKSK